ncbi:MAG TPA: hypothetical protein VF748_07120 [Candidatus Acidoferrum sp.]
MAGDIQDDDVVQSLLRNNLPLTRQNYIEQAWGEVPVPWTAEHEAELPEQLQDWSQFQQRA